MSSILPNILDLVWVAVLVIANGIYVAAEFAMVRSHPTRLKGRDLKRRYGVDSSLKLIDHLDLSLSTCQLGITVASLLLGWWGERTFNRLFFGFFALFGPTLQTVFSHAVATSLALVVITFLHVVLGELVAKSLAIRYPEMTLRIVAAPTLLTSVMFAPLIKGLTGCANIMLRFVGITGAAETERVHSSAELALMVSQSTQRGILDKDEEQMLHGVFSFSDTVAREVMTPRTDLVTLAVTSSFDQVVEIINQNRFSRYPVIGENVDEVIGILLIRDLLPYLNKFRNVGDTSAFDLRRAMREPYFVPGTKKIDDLLNEFKKRKLHIAVVVDEHGGVDGAVTLEDLIEEIVGEIFDESDIPEKDIIVEEDGNIVVDGGVLVSDLNSRFQLNIPEGDYDTIAGFIYTSLGRIPRPGDQILIKDPGVALINREEIAQHLAKMEELAQEQLEADALSEDSEVSISEQPPRAMVTVEHIQGRRIERVRLKQLVTAKAVESAPPEPASQPKAAVSTTEA